MTREERAAVDIDINGLRSELLGVVEEWDPVPPDQFQRRHDQYWSLVDRMIQAEPGNYGDLPDWMTEVGSDRLAEN